MSFTFPVRVRLLLAAMAISTAGMCLSTSIATAEVQAMTATSGIVSQASVFESLAAFPGGRHFEADFALPEGVVTGTGPTASGDPDLRKPFAALVEVDNGIQCWTLSNLENYDVSQRDGLIKVRFDARCDDGRGYDFYRVYLDARERRGVTANWSVWFGDRRSNATPHGQIAVTHREQAYVDMRVCGVVGGFETNCFSGFTIGTTYPNNPNLTAFLYPATGPSLGF
jgi:hypothetical protein